MTKEQKKVLDFYKAFELPFQKNPSFPEYSSVKLALNHIKEEVTELERSIAHVNIYQVADALADLQYVVLGAALRFGIDLEPVFNEVHIANMKKVWPPGTPLSEQRNSEGKHLKPPGWEPPDIHSVLLKLKEEEIK